MFTISQLFASGVPSFGEETKVEDFSKGIEEWRLSQTSQIIEYFLP